MTRSLAIGAVLAALGFATLHGSCSGKEAPVSVVEAAAADRSDAAADEKKATGLRAQPRSPLASGEDVIRPRKPERSIPKGSVPTRTHSSSRSTLQSDLER
ncbi:MAG: hypothetical protein AAF368_07050, partial [Planctomycetota bacterium]